MNKETVFKNIIDYVVSERPHPLHLLSEDTYKEVTIMRPIKNPLGCGYLSSLEYSAVFCLALDELMEDKLSKSLIHNFIHGIDNEEYDELANLKEYIYNRWEVEDNFFWQKTRDMMFEILTSCLNNEYYNQFSGDIREALNLWAKNSYDSIDKVIDIMEGLDTEFKNTKKVTIFENTIPLYEKLLVYPYYRVPIIIRFLKLIKPNNV